MDQCLIYTTELSLFLGRKEVRFLNPAIGVGGLTLYTVKSPILVQKKAALMLQT